MNIDIKQTENLVDSFSPELNGDPSLVSSGIQSHPLSLQDQMFIQRWSMETNRESIGFEKTLLINTTWDPRIRDSILVILQVYLDRRNDMIHVLTKEWKAQLAQHSQTARKFNVEVMNQSMARLLNAMMVQFQLEALESVMRVVGVANPDRPDPFEIDHSFLLSQTIVPTLTLNSGLGQIALDALEFEFNAKPYWTMLDRKRISSEMGLSIEQVCHWYKSRLGSLST